MLYLYSCLKSCYADCSDARDFVVASGDETDRQKDPIIPRGDSHLCFLLYTSQILVSEEGNNNNNLLQ